VIVVDPRRTPLARQADIHLAVRPGTDVVVALAIHRFLFEHGFADEAFLARWTRHADELRRRAAEWTFERAAAVAGVDPGLLEAAAELYAETSPAVCLNPMHLDDYTGAAGVPVPSTECRVIDEAGNELPAGMRRACIPDVFHALECASAAVGAPRVR